MNRMLYLAILSNLSSAPTSGVINKLLGQVEAFNKVGLQTELHLITYSSRSEKNLIQEYPWINIYNISISNRYLRRKAAFKKFDELVTQKNNIDILYIRYPLADHFSLSFLKEASKKVLVVSEHQAIEVHELRASKKITFTIKKFFERIYRKHLNKYIDARICVTKEIADYYKSVFPRTKIIQIGNGITVGKIPFRNSINSNNDIIKLGYVGNISSWNGLDLLINILSDMKFTHKGKKVELHIIGDGLFKKNLEKQVFDLNCTENVKFYGFLKKERFGILSNCDIGLGSLAPDRRKIREGSNLKLREYCALGLPFVKLDYDEDFDAFPIVKQFAYSIHSLNKNNIINILEFALRVKGNWRISQEMRRFAESKLDWVIKARQFMNFICNIKSKSISKTA